MPWRVRLSNRKWGMSVSCYFCPRDVRHLPGRARTDGPAHRPDGPAAQGGLPSLCRREGRLDDDARWRLDGWLLARHVLARRQGDGRRALPTLGARVGGAATAARHVGHRLPWLPLLLQRGAGRSPLQRPGGPRDRAPRRPPLGEDLQPQPPPLPPGRARERGRSGVVRSCTGGRASATFSTSPSGAPTGGSPTCPRAAWPAGISPRGPARTPSTTAPPPPSPPRRS